MAKKRKSLTSAHMAALDMLKPTAKERAATASEIRKAVEVGPLTTEELIAFKKIMAKKQTSKRLASLAASKMNLIQRAEAFDGDTVVVMKKSVALSISKCFMDNASVQVLSIVGTTDEFQSICGSDFGQREKSK